MKWTQEEAINFECACECITDLQGITLHKIREEESTASPNTERLANLEAEFSKLDQERKRLHVHNHAEIARIRSEYGAIIRAELVQQELVAA